MTKNLTNNTSPVSKKWLVISIAIGAIFMSIIILANVFYKISFSEYSNEATRIAQNSNLQMAGKEYDKYVDQRGDGVEDVFACGLFLKCPIVENIYLVNVESGNEMDFLRGVLTDSGYEIDESDITGTYSSNCILSESSRCSVSGKKLQYRASVFIHEDADLDYEARVIVRVEPEYGR